jgi:signal transduction histidine kinase
MRLVTKSTLAALVAFLILLGAFAVWSEYQLRSLATALMEGTAHLLGSEIAAVVSDVAAEDLLLDDPAARERLERMVGDLTANSQVVASVTVVGADGLVIASKDIEVGRQLARPEVIFGDTSRSQFLTAESPLEGGTYHLFVPLENGDERLGYLRLSIASEQLMSLYRRARRQLAFLAIAGLACVAALGLVLELQFSRMGRTLADAFEAATQGAVVPASSSRREFSEALDAARRAGEQLSLARTQTADAQARFGELMKVMDVGVVLVGSDYSLDFANEPARRLLRAAEGATLEQNWEGIQSRLQRAATAGAHSGSVDLEVADNDRKTTVRLELYPREDRAGWLILVKSREMLEALENELRLAIQMRAFAHFYMAFAHDLKAPLNAMVLNLELLKRSLAGQPADETDGEQKRTRQTRYIETLVGEVSRLDRSLRTVLTHAAPLSEGVKSFDLRELIEELGTLLDPQARHQRVDFKIALPPTQLRMTGHRDRLKQALLNVAINGLESMPKGGEMAIEAVTANGEATISIRDSGPGISPDVMEQIYKMHFTTKDGGTGIGLHVARSVIQAHGGDIQVQSQLGSGTCFRVNLPLVPPEPSEGNGETGKFLHQV